MLGLFACQVRVDSSTPTLLPVLRPSGTSPDASASASPHPGPSGSSSPSGDDDGTEFEFPPRATLRILQWNLKDEAQGTNGEAGRPRSHTARV